MAGVMELELCFQCSLINKMLEQLEPAHGLRQIYLCGGFNDELKSVVLTQVTVMDVPALESTQKEAEPVTKPGLHQ